MHVHCHLHKEEKNDQTKIIRTCNRRNERRNKEETKHHNINSFNLIHMLYHLRVKLGNTLIVPKGDISNVTSMQVLILITVRIRAHFITRPQNIGKGDDCLRPVST
jgi:hypothetical protein